MHHRASVCHWLTSALTFFLGLVVLAGCAEDLASTRVIEEPFAVYGVLSPDLDTQSVSVFPVQATPTVDLADAHGVEVISIHLSTGERVQWRDSIQTDSNRRSHLLFWSPFRAAFGGDYRIEVTRMSDEAMSFVTVRIPDRVTVRVDESRAPLVDVIVEGDGIRMLKPEAVYDVKKGPVLRFEVSYEGQERPVKDGWLLPVNMIVDAVQVNFLYNGFAPSQGGNCRVDFVSLESLSLRAMIGDEAWSPPGGVLDPNILSQPDALSNVENGFGFVGGGYEIFEPLTLSRETVESACFRYDD